MADKPSVLVIGAGIAGLTVAHRLRRAGVDVRVHEAGTEAGGVIRSRRDRGFLIESGPNTLLDTSDAVAALISELGLERSLMVPGDDAKNRYILRDGAIHALPRSPVGLARTPLLSVKAKARLLAEPFIREGEGTDATVADFFRRRLGAEVVDYLVNPFISGIYAGDPEKLAMRHAFPKISRLADDYRSLLLGGIRGRRPGARKPRLVSFCNGLAELPRAMASGLGRSLHLSSPVIGLERKGDAWQAGLRRGGERADAVVLTLPAHACAALSAPPALTEKFALLKQIRYAGLAVVALGFRRDDVAHPLDGFGALFPECEGRRTLGALFSSSLFPGRAPEGHVLLTAFIGGERSPSVLNGSDDVIATEVIRDLTGLLGIGSDPVFISVERHRSAIPQYEQDYDRFLEAMAALEEENPGLYLAGSFRGGISVPETIESAIATAARVEEYLR